MSSLAPALLLSMPQLMDPNFARTVVLLCKHSEDGAFGLVMNRPLVTTGTVMVHLDPPVSTDRELDIWIGGPVEPQRSWILVGGGPEHPEVSGAAQIADGVYLSTSPALLRRLLEPDPPSNTRLIVGYSGWGPGQLEQELAESSWLLSDVDPDLVFNTPAEKMWEAAIRRLGADPAALTASRGVH
ncbi:MAG: YqgE/AlgH family protein [Vicinamibacterales bacterium]